MSVWANLCKILGQNPQLNALINRLIHIIHRKTAENIVEKPLVIGIKSSSKYKFYNKFYGGGRILPPLRIIIHLTK